MGAGKSESFRLAERAEKADKLCRLRACRGPQGVSSNGFKEADYEVITREYPLAAAEAFAGLRKPSEPKLVFAYVSGASRSLSLLVDVVLKFSFSYR